MNGWVDTSACQYQYGCCLNTATILAHLTPSNEQLFTISTYFTATDLHPHTVHTCTEALMSVYCMYKEVMYGAMSEVQSRAQASL